MNKEFIIALEELEKTKNVDKRIILEALEKAIGSFTSSTTFFREYTSISPVSSSMLTSTFSLLS